MENEQSKFIERKFKILNVQNQTILITFCFILFCSPLATAQPIYNEVEQGIETAKKSTSYEEWFESTNESIINNGLNTHVQRLAYALVFAFLAYSVIQAALLGSITGLKQVFLRLVIVGAIFATLDQSQQALYSTWRNSVTWSETLSSKALADAALQSENVSLLLAPVGGMLAAARMAGTRLGKNVAVKATKPSVGSKLGQFFNASFLLLMPILAIYSMIVYSTGLIVLLSMLFLPLAAAFLMVSNGSWLWRWLSAYLGAIFIALFVPIIFGIATNLAVTQPLESLGEFLATSQDHFITAMEEFQTPEGASAWNINKWREWANGLDDAALSILRGITTAILGWIIALVMMAFGLFAGAYLMLKMPSYIGSYLGSSDSGGLVTGPASMAGAGFLSARLRGRVGTTANKQLTSGEKALPSDSQGGNRR